MECNIIGSLNNNHDGFSGNSISCLWFLICVNLSPVFERLVAREGVGWSNFYRYNIKVTMYIVPR